MRQGKVGGLAVAAALLAAALAAQPPEPPADPPSDAAAELRPEHAGFLETAALLLSPAERDAFLALARPYQRDAFIERFWRVRDPFPDTAVNELRDRWEERATQARDRYGGLDDDRARMLLINGEPAETLKAPCRTVLRPIELWRYRGTDKIQAEFWLAFVQRQARPEERYRLWRPSEGLTSLVTGSIPMGREPLSAVDQVAQECARGGDVLGALAGCVDWDSLARKTQPLPQPSDEWLRTFEARSTALPAGATPLRADLALRYPGRRQSRTVVEAVLSVPRADAAANPSGGYNFLVDGEVLRGDELFDSFRYRFDLPPDAAPEALPLLLERSLRPGGYTLILRLQDVNGQRFFRAEQAIEVPQVEPAAPQVAAAPTVPASREPAAVAAPAPLPNLAEADAALPAGDHTVKLFTPAAELQTGRVRVEATTQGDGVARVAFALNGKTVLAKSRPPWSVELDLGAAPRTHVLRAAAFDAAGQELASDQVLLNAGPHSFRLRLIEPQRGGRYTHSLRAQAAVDVPAGETLERVEFFLNEQRVATLYQPPFVQPILLPPSPAITYVRAVAFLDGGISTEDLAFVNAPEFAAEVKVDLVELYTTVVDRRGRPAEGLARGEFTVLEDGAEQEIVRFERVRDLPVHAGILIDTSSSMLEILPDATRAALTFFRDVITPKDRAAVITFAERPQLTAPFSSNHDVLAGGLAAASAEGETALWDAVVFAVHYFSGLRGKRAVVLLSDMMDTRSKYDFAEAMEFARRSGVAFYIIALHTPQREIEARASAQRLATETGGRIFFLERATAMERIYSEIEEELRTQYLLAYQSAQSRDGGAAKYRTIEVKVARPGLEARTIRGYLP